MAWVWQLALCAGVVGAFPAIARLGRQVSRGRAAGAMMAIGFIFATLFEGKPPQVTEKSIKREDEDRQTEKAERRA